MTEQPPALEIRPLPGSVDAVIEVPGSKSYTNRALLVAALAEGRSVLRGALISDDTERMADSLNRLEIPVRTDAEACRFEVDGVGGRVPARSAELFVGNAGTAARFLLALVTLGHGRFVLDGTARMRQRPVGPLLSAIGDLGGRAVSLNDDGCLPVAVEADRLPGGRARMPGSQSSQYFSALLMVGPCTALGITLDVEGDLVSRPYLDLTADVMAAFGARSERQGYHQLVVPGGQQYRSREYAVPPDASNASYFFAAAALTGGRVTVPGLGTESLQGDLEVLEVLESMGCSVDRQPDSITVQGPPELSGVDADMNACSDMAQTIAALAPFAKGSTTIRNIAHTRLQETDRIHATATELRRLGQEVEERPDGLQITPRPVRPGVIQTYDDHRMAMAFSLVGLREQGVFIADPGCVRKTFPDYFQRLELLRSASAGATPPAAP